MLFSYYAEICLGSVSELVSVLVGAEGINSKREQDVDATLMAISCAMEDIPEDFYPPMLCIIKKLLERCDSSIYFIEIAM